MMQCSRMIRGVGLVLAIILVAGVVHACSVPVFRYALERWEADPYVVFVFHKGPLDSKQQAQVDRLKRNGQAGKTSANVQVVTCDLDNSSDPDLLQVWRAQETETLPWMVVHYPAASRNPAPVWRGPLEEKQISSLLASPLRKKIADSLVEGTTAVWVLLESGDKAADSAAAALLAKRLKYLETTLKLPEISEEDIAQGLVLIDPDELKIKFSLVRLSRTDAAEAMFVEMLLSSEEDLRGEAVPMVFPMFGRGRALYALVNKGINHDTIDQAGKDLTGPCTCTIKEQNPGIDMLMPVAWDELVQKLPQPDKPLPPLVGLTGFGEISDTDDPPGDDPKPAKSVDGGDDTKPLKKDETAASTEPATASATSVSTPTTPSGNGSAGSVFSSVGWMGLMIVGLMLFLGSWFLLSLRR